MPIDIIYTKEKCGKYFQYNGYRFIEKPREFNYGLQEVVEQSFVTISNFVYLAENDKEFKHRVNKDSIIGYFWIPTPFGWNKFTPMIPRPIRYQRARKPKKFNRKLRRLTDRYRDRGYNLPSPEKITSDFKGGTFFREIKKTWWELLGIELKPS